MYPMRPTPVPRPNSLATWSLVLGLVGIVLPSGTMATDGFALDLYYYPISGLIAIVAPVLAVVFGHVGLVRARRGARGKGLAVTGLVLGYLMVAVVVPRLILSFSAVSPVQ